MIVVVLHFNHIRIVVALHFKWVVSDIQSSFTVLLIVPQVYGPEKYWECWSHSHLGVASSHEYVRS